MVRDAIGQLAAYKTPVKGLGIPSNLRILVLWVGEEKKKHVKKRVHFKNKNKTKRHFLLHKNFTEDFQLKCQQNNKLGAHRTLINMLKYAFESSSGQTF